MLVSLVVSMSNGIPLLLLFSLFGISSQQTLLIENQPLSTNVNEKSQTAGLLAITCINTNTSNYAINKLSQSPTQCDNCFQIIKDHDVTHTGHWLWYHAGVGTLDYTVNNLYTLTINCDDAVVTPVTATLTINITPNRPPVITTSSVTCQNQIQWSTVKAGDNVFAPDPVTDAGISDPDGDPIYYSMTVVPASSSSTFTIGETDGIIRATQDLTKECTPSFSFFVSVTDKMTNPPGPVVISCAMAAGYNKAPVITNVNKEIQVPEDSAIGFVIGDVFTVQNTVPAYTYEISTSPAAAVSLVTTGIDNVRVAQKLNYESTNRNFNLTIRPDNGLCTPINHWLFVRVTDRNDPPVLAPKTDFYAVYERTSLASDPSVSSININWGPIVTDEDYDDLPGSHIFSIVTGNTANLWKIDRTTGVISSNGIYDVDQSAMPGTATLLVQVADADGGIDNATINIRIDDYNDHRPIINPASYTFSITDCTPAGLLGTMVATDLDLGATNGVTNNNNVFEFDFVTSGAVTVDQTGAITLTSTMTAGTSVTLSVGATDKGTPTPLSSLTKAVVVVSSTACPTTVPPVTVATVAVVPVTVPVIVVSNGINSFPDVAATGAGQSATANSGTMTWIILAALLGALLLGLLAYMLFKYCFPYCKQGGYKTIFQKRQPTPQVRPVEVKERKEGHKAPPQSPSKASPAEPEQPDPYIYDFWKEKESTATQWVYTGTSLEYEPSPPVGYGSSSYANPGSSSYANPGSSSYANPGSSSYANPDYSATSLPVKPTATSTQLLKLT